MAKKKTEAQAIAREVVDLQRRVKKLQQEGIDVGQITAALSQLSTDVDALIAKGSGSITPAQVQSIVDGIGGGAV